MNNIAILRAGWENPNIAARFPDDSVRFQRLFKPVFNGAEMPVIDLWALPDGKATLPESLDAHDGYILTGSPSAVYEDLPWLPPLFAFIRRLYAAKKPLFGVCFGHQAIAMALGGKVEKSDRGWGLGLRTVPFFKPQPWMSTTSERPMVRLLHSHQDQVVEPPPKDEIETLAGDDFCPYSCLAAGNHLLTIQGHPEFDRAFLSAKIDLVAHELPDGGAQARRSLDTPDDGTLFVRWLQRFWNMDTRQDRVSAAS